MIYRSFISRFAHDKNTSCILCMSHCLGQGWTNLLNIEAAYSSPLLFGNRRPQLDGVFRCVPSTQHSPLHLSIKKEIQRYSFPQTALTVQKICTRLAFMYVCHCLDKLSNSYVTRRILYSGLVFLASSAEKGKEGLYSKVLKRIYYSCLYFRLGAHMQFLVAQLLIGRSSGSAHRMQLSIGRL
jgi:hypothetical protein